MEVAAALEWGQARGPSSQPRHIPLLMVLGTALVLVSRHSPPPRSPKGSVLSCDMADDGKGNKGKECFKHFSKEVGSLDGHLVM